jgi:hypothetical protein
MLLNDSSSEYCRYHQNQSKRQSKIRCMGIELSGRRCLTKTHPKYGNYCSRHKNYYFDEKILDLANKSDLMKQQISILESELAWDGMKITGNETEQRFTDFIILSPDQTKPKRTLDEFINFLHSQTK